MSFRPSQADRCKYQSLLEARCAPTLPARSGPPQGSVYHDCIGSSLTVISRSPGGDRTVFVDDKVIVEPGMGETIHRTCGDHPQILAAEIGGEREFAAHSSFVMGDIV